MSTLLQAALLGVLQGLTEFLPVSSTAHLLIGARILGFSDPGGVFTVVIQFGSILAVMYLYRAKILALIAGFFGGGRLRRFALAIVAGAVPAAVAGFLLAKFVKTVLYESFGTIAVAFIIGGIVMLLVERLRPTPVVHEAEEISMGRGFVVGIGQTLALIPGVSRSGGTIVTGLLLGLDRRAAAEFSFFLAMPTMAGAFAHDLWEARHVLAADRVLEIGVGFVMAFISAFFVVRPFLNFVSRSGFDSFAWYRIALGVALLAALGAGWL